MDNMSNPRPFHAENCRRLFLHDLVLQVRMGIHEFERQQPQRLIICIDVFVSLSETTPKADLIQEVVDYDFMRLTAMQLAQQGHIDLQETLCDQIMDAMLAHRQVIAARVSTRKPDVYPDCAGVGVEVFRQK
jgi:dihydroneopterin aldolase